ncbi:MAG TPA: C1 family peptidase [Saprospiraceae bacterium]|nr:C1 family peptidase [Saprospiraceae bacterium]HMQ82985.1 C1 family peptidase [Saprospiraceae bacterium]
MTGLNAQNRSTGLLLSPERYETVPLLPTYSGVKYNEIPLKVSLKKYCPVAGDQGEMGSCVGWAVGYGALTISQAEKRQETDQANITKMAHSAAFVYNQIRAEEDNCTQGAFIEDALMLLQTQGDCLENTFNFKGKGCQALPPLAAQEEAKKYRILDYAAVFELQEPAKSKIAKVCKILAAQIPVVVGLEITPSFWDVLPGDKIWNPGASESTTGNHGMVLVGYDNVEKQVELLNSFGPGWGNNGFIKMSFEDFARLCSYSYILLSDDKMKHLPIAEYEANTESEPGQLLKGAFVFRRPAGYILQADGTELVFFEEIPTIFQPEEGVYEPVQPVFDVGDAFQLIAREVLAGEYIYVFSKTPQGETKLHFPKLEGKRPGADFALSHTVELILPSEETVLQLAEPGVDYLCIVYSKAKIQEMPSYLARINESDKDFPTAVRESLQELLIPDDQIRRLPRGMSVEATVTPETGEYATMIILRVIAQ